MLRISTANSHSSGVASLQERQRELSQAQAQLVSGKRVAMPSDDPTAAARAERAMAAVARAEANQRALEASRSAMTMSEAALGDGVELVQQARELIMAAGNASYDASQRGDLTQQLRGLRAQLLQVANRGDGTGGFLFGRQDSVEPPFIDLTGTVQASSPSQRRLAAADEPMPLNLDGEATWLKAPTGNGAFETRALTTGGGAWIDAGQANQQTPITSTYQVRFSVSGGNTTFEVFRDGNPTPINSGPYQAGTAIDLDPVSDMRVTISGTPVDGETFEAVPSTDTLSVFDTLDRTIAALEANGAGNAQVTQAVQFGLRDLDQALANLGSQRADAGSWLNRLDNIEQRLSGQKLQSQTERSNAEDLDMVQAVSDFSNKQSSYQAALQAYASVQKLSLFQFLNGG